MTSTCPAGHTSGSDDYCDVCGMPIDPVGAGPATPPPPTDVPTQAPAGQLCPNCSTHNVADALFCEACGYDFTTGTMPRSAVPEAAEVAAAPRPLTPPDGAAPLSPPDGAAPPAAPHSVAPLSPPDGLSAPAQPEAPAAPDVPGAAGRPSTKDGGAVVTPATPDRPADSGFGWVAEVWIDPAWYDVQDSPEALPSAGLPTVVALRNRSVLIGRRSRSRNIHPDIDCETDTGTSRRQAQLTTDGTRWWVEDLESANGTFVAAASDPLPEDPIPAGVKHELAPDDRIYLGAWTRIVIREATDEEKTTLG